MKPETVVVNYIDQATTGEYLAADRWTTFDGSRYSPGSFLRMVEKKYGPIEIIRGTQIFIKPQKISKSGKIALRQYCFEMGYVNHGLMKKVKDIVRTKQNPSNKFPDDLEKYFKNYLKWTFVLKTKGTSDDFSEPLALTVVDGFLFAHDSEAKLYEVGDVKVMFELAKNNGLDVLPVRQFGSKSERLKGYLNNCSAIFQEITHNGMSLKDFVNRKNPKVKKGDITVEIVETPPKKSKNPTKKLWPQEGK